MSKCFGRETLCVFITMRRKGMAFKNKMQVFGRNCCDGTTKKFLKTPEKPEGTKEVLYALIRMKKQHITLSHCGNMYLWLISHSEHFYIAGRGKHIYHLIGINCFRFFVSTKTPLIKLMVHP